MDLSWAVATGFTSAIFSPRSNQRPSNRRSATLMVLGGLLRGKFAALFAGPPRLIDLPSPRNPERVRGNVVGNRRSGGNVRPVADFHRSHQRRIAADEHFVADPRGVLCEAVVVTGDRAGADIRFAADLRVAKISRGRGLGPFTHGVLFQFDKIAEARAALQMRFHAYPRE